MSKRLRGGIGAWLALVLLTLFAPGCSKPESKSESKPDSKVAETKSSKTEPAVIQSDATPTPASTAPGEALVQVLETLPKDQ